MCVLSIKVPIRKKSGNLSHAPPYEHSMGRPLFVVFFFEYSVSKSLYGVVVNVLNCNIVLSEFELHFQIKSLVCCMKSLISPAMGWIALEGYVYKDSFDCK